MADRTILQPGDAAAAIIVFDDGRYLLQLRDNKQGIFFPGHWGLFGGGVESGEQPIDALRRELKEELGLAVVELRRLARFEFNLVPMGLTHIYREFFEVRLPAAIMPTLRLGEGKAFEAFTRDQVLASQRLVPYDSFALWFHVNEFRLHG
ncbi:MAG: NUDIX domain-containing protein [Proteobacteria bacterium]|nr:NUDIX domain-containing protein [Pseudomonadota bacterium]